MFGHRKFVNLVLLAALATTQYALWFGDKNVFDLHKLQASERQASELNLELRLRNQRLNAEVVDLKQGGETLESVARSQLGLVRSGETFYQVIESR